ncbi:hypothetical protein [Neisseria sp.]|uniref:hypothetical protein n=1 Tax=Neisseria sp. TaxID=192066 RepID=UPI00359F4566
MPHHVVVRMPSETSGCIQTACRNIRYHAVTGVYLRDAETVYLSAPLTKPTAWERCPGMKPDIGCFQTAFAVRAAWGKGCL